mgnify:CR=1 FL=1
MVSPLKYTRNKTKGGMDRKVDGGWGKLQMKWQSWTPGQGTPLGTVDIWGWKIPCGWTGPGQRGMFSSFPGLCPLDASSVLPFHS